MPSKPSPKQLFLLDGLGALVTALLLSQILTKWESLFGMPQHTLYTLAGIACCFATYSLMCYFWIKKNEKPYLLAIAIANMLYCILTVGLVIHWYETLKRPDLLYFIGEVFIISGLVYLEFKSAYSDFKSD